jgi:hypothetical protein
MRQANGGGVGRSGDESTMPSQRAPISLGGGTSRLEGQVPRLKSSTINSGP